jgi:uncharacterized protein (TIGR02646 family)
MRNIRKGPEPPSLTAWRNINPTDYNGYRDKDTLRAMLIAEQRGICCYCECRLYAAWNLMKLEHWHSQENYPTERLVYRNLLGACLGGIGTPGRDQHCDTSKGEQDLSRNPADPTHDVEVLLRYRADGKISSTNTQFDEELNTVLKLNQPFLMNSRKAVLDSLKRALRIRGGTLTKAKWQNILNDWNGSNYQGDLRPYCSVIVYWARKHLARVS